MTADREPAAKQSDSLVGRTVAQRYRVEALLARGGMARVYRARDERLDRDVAIKVLSAPYADDPAFTERFLAEARAAASLSHPSLVHVYDSGSDGDSHFIVMELLDRHRSLRQEVDANGPLRRDEVLRIGTELLRGLQVVHDRGLVHCDVKSGNVMLGPGPAKLIDFGIARSPSDAPDAGTSIGSLRYMSPEQLRGETLTPASDLFSLGVVLYEALTGRVPYPGATPEEVSDAHAAGSPQPPSSVGASAGSRLDDAILQALRPDPKSRFHSAAAMAQALASGADVIGRDDDTTRVVSVPAAEPRSRAGSGGYIPPPLPPAPPRAPPRPPARGVDARGTRRRGRAWGVLGTFLLLGAAALVVAFVVLPLLGVGGSGTTPEQSPPAEPTATARPGTVLVPSTIGLPTQEAIAAASEAGLDWTVRCDDDQAQPEGIINQEPPAGTPVAPGSTFTMYSARISDCR